MRSARVGFDSLEARRLFAATPPANGLLVTYFDNVDFTGTSVEGYQQTAATTRSNESRPLPIEADNYSVRWSGKLRAPSTEVYRFYLATDGAVRLKIRGETVIDSQRLDTEQRLTKGSLKFTAGKRYDVVIEYRHGTGSNPLLELKWQTDTRSKQTIPTRWYTPAAATDVLTPDQQLDSQLTSTIAFAEKQAARTLADLPSPAAGIPIRSNPDGTWYTGDKTNWTSGYFGGSLWQLDTMSPGEGFAAKATQWTLPLETEAATRTGDFYSSVWITYQPLYAATGKKAYRLVLQRAADEKLKQFDETVGAFETPGVASRVDPSADFPVLMDQTMDLELMLFASKSTGNPIYRERAEQHLATVIDHLMRPDGSVFQRGFFRRDDGSFSNGQNYQGYSDTSTWSRAQSWAIRSFATMAEATGRSDFLAAARKVADHWIAHVESDGVPLWDFHAPSNLPYRDSSAAAIAAGGLLTLAEVLGDAEGAPYLAQAKKTLTTLTSPAYLTSGQFAKSRGLLAHAADNVPKQRGVDTATVYGDFYLLEAIAKYSA